MNIRKFHVYLADLNPVRGTEPGKTRPVVVVQTDLLNNEHPSTIVCPVSTNVKKEATLLRVHLAEGPTGLNKPSDILVDQIRAIDNRRFIKEMGKLPVAPRETLVRSLKVLLLE